MDNNLVLRPHPFSNEHGLVRVPVGQTVQQMLDALADGEPLAPTLRVEVGGYEVPAAMWSLTRPKAGTPIHVTVMPAGSGGGESSGKKWIRTLLLIVVAVVAMWATGGGAATASGWFAAGSASAYALGAAISIIGGLSVPALTPEAA